MSQPLRMHQIRRIIELYQEGRSIWETKRLTGLSRNTVRDYLRRIQSSGLSAAQLLALDDESLSAIVYVDGFEQGRSGRKLDARYQTIEKNLDRYCSELRRQPMSKTQGYPPIIERRKFSSSGHKVLVHIDGKSQIHVGFTCVGC